MKAVGQLYQDDAYVLGHRNEHLAHARRLPCGPLVQLAVPVDSERRRVGPVAACEDVHRVHLGHAVDQLCDIVAELFLDLLSRDVAVFDHVM